MPFLAPICPPLPSWLSPLVGVALVRPSNCSPTLSCSASPLCNFGFIGFKGRLYNANWARCCLAIVPLPVHCRPGALHVISSLQSPVVRQPRKHFCLNIPLQDGIDDEMYLTVIFTHHQRQWRAGRVCMGWLGAGQAQG